MDGSAKPQDNDPAIGAPKSASESASVSASGARLFLVDGSGYIFRAYHALPPLTRASDGLPVGAVAGFCNMLWKFLGDMKEKEAPTHLAVVFDRSEDTFRKQIFPEYKANRPPAPEDLAPQFPLIRDATRAFNIPVVELEGYEADDLIATYARQAARAGAEVLIVSSDKDLMQLIDDNRIRLYDPMKQKPIGPAEVIEKFGVPPEKVIDVQALIGDSVDNIPGAPGIGPKTAAELIGLFGSLEEILARAGEIKQPKRRETLIGFAEQIRLSKKLVTLDDDSPVPTPWETFAVQDPQDGALLKFLDEMEFRTLGRRVREHFAKEGAREASSDHASAAAAPHAAIDPAKYQTLADLPALHAFLAQARAEGLLSLAVKTTHPDNARAALVGVAMAVGPGRAAYLPLTHVHSAQEGGDLFAAAAQLCEGQIPRAAALEALKPVLQDAGILKIGCDVKAAIKLLSRDAVALTPFDDVMLISYALAAGLHGHGLDELAERHLEHLLKPYAEIAGSGKKQIGFDRVPIATAALCAAEQADVIWRLWRKLKPQLAQAQALAVYETLERPLPAVLARMEQEGVRIDPDELSRMSGEFAQRMAALEAQAHELAGKNFNLGSPKQIGEILFGEMKLAGGGKTKSGAYSTDASVLEDLAAEGHALPRVLLEWRQISKLRSTYCEALAEAIDPRTKRVHTSFALAATTTGRLSSFDPNLQNIPIRTEEGRRIRRAFVAAPGNVLISADYSQIELRLLAHVADIPALKKAFLDGLDIHAMTASEMFGVPIAGMDPMVRRQAKAINFGIIYGISAFGLANNLGIGRDEASAYIKRYFERFPGIRDYMDQAKAFARANGFVRTIFGRKCWIAGIKSKTPNERAFAERQAINAPLQGAAADIIRRAMVRIPAALAREGLKARMLLQVHDELVFEAPAQEAEPTKALVSTLMAQAPNPAVQLTVPLAVEARAAANWADAH